MMKKTQETIVSICFTVSFISMFYILFFTYNKNTKFRLFIPIAPLLCSLSLSFGSLVMFASEEISPSIFGKIVNEKLFRMFIIMFVLIRTILLYIVLPIIFSKRTITHKSVLKAA